MFYNPESHLWHLRSVCVLQSGINRMFNNNFYSVSESRKKHIEINLIRPSFLFGLREFGANDVHGWHTNGNVQMVNTVWHFKLPPAWACARARSRRRWQQRREMHVVNLFNLHNNLINFPGATHSKLCIRRTDTIGETIQSLHAFKLVRTIYIYIYITLKWCATRLSFYKHKLLILLLLLFYLFDVAHFIHRRPFEYENFWIYFILCVCSRAARI